MTKEYPQLLLADAKGKIYNVPSVQAAGMKAGHFYRLGVADLKPLPACSQLFMLPGRVAVGLDPQSGAMVRLKRYAFGKAAQPCFPVAVFLAPGHTATYHAAYAYEKREDLLPLFAYAAAAFYRGRFYGAGVCVDRELRQDARYMDLTLMRKNISRFKKLFPQNRLIRHLENCACVNGCPAAKNFFLQRYEAPLPTSPSCNAQCAGCISYQPQDLVPVTQERIQFVPTPQEIAEVALFHLKHVAQPVVSFGQGCEGEPLMVSDTIEQAVRLIRRKTGKGIINLNTNASRPDAVARLCDAGLDSMRVSLNSTQALFYERYYCPRDYDFFDVLASIRQAKRKGIFVSLNYLTVPGFTDSIQEFQSLKKFLDHQAVNMIQWRNLNFDPYGYFHRLKYEPGAGDLIGIGRIIHDIHRQYPSLIKGYFNPSRARMRRHQNS